MKTLRLYRQDEDGTEQDQIGKLWVENERLVIQPHAPESRAAIDDLLAWFSAQNLCSRDILDFVEFTSFSVAAECRMDDADYLEVLAEAAERCPTAGKRIRGEIVDT